MGHIQAGAPWFRARTSHRIGPWRVQWWRRYAQGYRLAIDSSYSGSTFWRLNQTSGSNPANPRRLQRILARHRTSPNEWLLLAGIDSQFDKRAGHFADRVADFAARTHKITLSKEAWRDNLANCLRKGWIQILDAKALASIQSSLSADPTLAPFHEAVGRAGEVDFTETGAALYQTISAEHFGSDWDAGIYLEKLCSWKEHSYSESEEWLQKHLQEHSARGATVLNVDIKPIETWCSRWYERFPDRYMLEAEFGG